MCNNVENDESPWLDGILYLIFSRYFNNFHFVMFCYFNTKLQVFTFKGFYILQKCKEFIKQKDVEIYIFFVFIFFFTFYLLNDVQKNDFENEKEIFFIGFNSEEISHAHEINCGRLDVINSIVKRKSKDGNNTNSDSGDFDRNILASRFLNTMSHLLEGKPRYQEKM